MLTYQEYPMAFSNSAEREVYFSCEREVEPGTAMKHVLATNLGLWGDREALAEDAARIMRFEINTLRKRQGKPLLQWNIPTGLIANHQMFRDIFNKLAAINSNELDYCVRNGGEEKRSPLPDRASFLLGSGFTEALALAISGRAAKYASALNRSTDRLRDIEFGVTD